jgi:hypothetical protein
MREYQDLFDIETTARLEHPSVMGAFTGQDPYSELRESFGATGRAPVLSVLCMNCSYMFKFDGSWYLPVLYSVRVHTRSGNLALYIVGDVGNSL